MELRRIALLFLLLLFAAMPAAAQQMQKFHVESFGENSFDMSAREKPTSRDDGTGKLYAIIKVRSTAPDDDLKAYNLDFDYLKDVQEMHDGVLWVYVQYGAKTVTIKRDGFYTVERYDLKTTLQPGKVYDMKIKPEPKVISMQFLMFKVSPADSRGMIMYADESGNEKLLGQLDENGALAEKLVLGRYSYRIISKNYHDSEGIVTLSTPNGKHIETVTLRPNFARITLTVENGAEIYINDEKRGTGQWSGNLAPGTYSIECRKAKHKSTLETITVEDGKNTTHALKAPTPIVGSLSISSSPLEAAIFIDGASHGETPNIIEGLLVGAHKVTVSKEGYGTVSLDVTIKENETTEHNVQLKKKESPAPVVSQGNVQNSGSTVRLGSKTSAPYKVGDYYNDGTKEGVVFEVSNGGYSGKIVSLEQNKFQWSKKQEETGAASKTDGTYNMQKIRSLPNWQNDYPMFAWCASLGNEWYLPADSELKVLAVQSALVNNTLKAQGKPELDDWYWSSSQYNKFCGLFVRMNDRLHGFGSKYIYYNVRAVSAFSAEGSASSSKTSAPYKVGDYYNDGTKEGVVFEVSNGGYNGKIVSLKQNHCQWAKKSVETGATSETDGMYNMRKIRSLRKWQKDYPAFAWCASLGKGWYLPTLEELKTIKYQRAVINNTLKALGVSEIMNRWWSSTEGRFSDAYDVTMLDGGTYGYSDKHHNAYVRAVSAF